MDVKPISAKPPVLIVDDDPNILSGLGDILEDCGYEVKGAFDAEEAWKLLGQYPFRVMITDYSLPDDNGIDLARRAKKQYPHLGLILMTGHDPEYITQKIDPQIMQFFRKPVDVPILLEAI